MSNLQHRQSLIQAKRKQTPWRDFVMEICSWYNFALYKNNGLTSRYPEVERNKNIVNDLTISMNCDLFGDDTIGFIKGFVDLYTRSKKSRTLNFGANENCDFTDSCYGAKNCYLSFGLGGGAENSLYSFFVARNCSNIINTMSATYNCSNIYSSKGIKESFNIFYSTNIYTSSDVRFSSNLIGCHECIFCDDLQNQSYCINNKSYEKDDYLKEKNTILSQKGNFIIWHSSALNRLGNIGSVHCSGKGITKSKNIENGYNVIDGHNSRNIVLFEGGDSGSYDIYDGIDVGIDSHDFYATCQTGSNADHLYCCIFVGMSSNCYYCMNLDTCSFCLGCIGLKNKSYCILNKQYTKEERYEKVDEIFSQMEKDGTLGEFFPASMNPFYFNDTAAYLIDPSFTKEEVTARGYLRRDEPIKVDIPEGAKVAKTSELDRFEGWRSVDILPHPSPLPTTPLGEGGLFEQQWYIDPEILKYIIQDEQGNVYRIVKMEYDFLMKHGLPLPRKHWLDRMKENFRIH